MILSVNKISVYDRKCKEVIFLVAPQALLLAQKQRENVGVSIHPHPTNDLGFHPKTPFENGKFTEN